MPGPGPLREPVDRADAVELARAEAGYPGRADYYYRWSIVDDPRSASAWVALGNLYGDNGRADAGLAILDLAIEREPDDSYLHNGRGRLLLNIGEPAAAVESYGRALELQPDAAAVLFGLGMAYAELPDRKRATETLERFLIVGKDSPEHVRKAAQDTIMRMSAVY